MSSSDTYAPTPEEEQQLKTHGVRLTKDKLGSGGIATVYKGNYVNAGEGIIGLPVAVKILDRSKHDEAFVEKFADRSIKVHLSLRHDNIVRCFKAFSIGTKTYLIQELCQSDLFDYFTTICKSKMEEETAKTFFRPIANAVDYIHSKNIVHRDIKLENILIGVNGQAKLGDFDFARELHPHEESVTFVGSDEYMAPEIRETKRYKGLKCDIYSLGVVLFLLICGDFPGYDTEVMKGVLASLDISDELKDLVTKMLEPNPRIRLSSAQVVEHPWFFTRRPFEKRRELFGKRILDQMKLMKRQ